jgi:hypothetical protein
MAKIRIIGPTILAVGIVCAPVLLAGMPVDNAAARTQPQTTTQSIKGDRLDRKPPRADLPVRGPVRFAVIAHHEA